MLAREESPPLSSAKERGRVSMVRVRVLLTSLALLVWAAPVSQATRRAQLFRSSTPPSLGTGASGDELVGTTGTDVIVGLGGSDAIYGGGGADFICGQAGWDRLYGGGDDSPDGGDHISGGAGNDGDLIGGDGNGIINGNGGSDYQFQGGRGRRPTLWRSGQRPHVRGRSGWRPRLRSALRWFR